MADKARSIKGLPGWVWVYPGEHDPITGVKAKTRYGLELLTGTHKSVRKTQEMQRGGRYETLIPESQRKKYRKKTEKGDYYRYGPFFDLKEALNYTSSHKDFKPDNPSLLQAYGKHKKTGSIKAGKRYATVTTRMPYSQLQSELSRLAAGTPGINLFQKRTDELLKDFQSIEKYYVYRKA